MSGIHTIVMCFISHVFCKGTCTVNVYPFLNLSPTPSSQTERQVVIPAPFVEQSEIVTPLRIENFDL